MAIYSVISIGMINAGISSKKRNYHLRGDLIFFFPLWLAAIQIPVAAERCCKSLVHFQTSLHLF